MNEGLSEGREIVRKDEAPRAWQQREAATILGLKAGGGERSYWNMHRLEEAAWQQPWS